VIRRAGDWISTRVGDEAMMMSAERGRYIGLTETGARIWDLLVAPRTVEYLCAELCREFDVEPALCRAEVDAFIVDMEKHGALLAETR